MTAFFVGGTGGCVQVLEMFSFCVAARFCVQQIAFSRVFSPFSDVYGSTFKNLNSVFGVLFLGSVLSGGFLILGTPRAVIACCIDLFFRSGLLCRGVNGDERCGQNYRVLCRAVLYVLRVDRIAIIECTFLCCFSRAIFLLTELHLHFIKRRIIRNLSGLVTCSSQIGEVVEFVVFYFSCIGSEAGHTSRGLSIIWLRQALKRISFVSCSLLG